MITNNERIRMRRQMQRRIQDLVAERRRARQIERSTADSADPASAPHVTASDPG